ncbi:tripartite tricarboxylate transporter permease [Spiractinospora alimapuensis]|uniref:tripartite tricarboxylate transporter permease n=1 Tax=Spiractinospora alimapuensis TaxID=2820884 RepID=UPI001F1CAEBB|nr:tripartite tricarboxylate transporter permease [Spiractinospora alimapuensis]QVQ53724.1 tripartite tricarboxylate transporter permease [Spiractinospora alimapuensis]
MDSLSFLMSGFADIFSDPAILLAIAIGCLAGTLVGVIPGLGPSTTIALLIPLAFILPAEQTLVMMVAIYLGAEFGGRVAAILLNIPGDAGAIMTTVDGYPMARQGRGRTALVVTAIASFCGSSIAIIGLTFLAMPLASAALAFSPGAFFGVIVFALLLSSTLVGDSPLKGLLAMGLGLIVGTIGIDLQTGVQRFTFGQDFLLEGVDLIVAILGLYGVGEILWNMRPGSSGTKDRVAATGGFWPNKEDRRRIRGPILRGSLAGFFAGVLPGPGTTLASFFSYSMEKRLSKTPERFGRGAVEGVAAPEAGNNAGATGSMVPLLSLGIPGSGTAAVLLAFLVSYGLQPGPGFFTENADLAWIVIASLYLSTVLLVAINLPFISLFVKILDVPTRFLYPLILAIAVLSAFSLHSSIADAGMVLVFGAIGYVMRLVGMSPTLFVIALVLGSMMERNFRRGLLLHNGELGSMLVDPLTLTFLVLGVAIVALGAIGNARKKRQRTTAPSAH